MLFTLSFTIFTFAGILSISPLLLCCNCNLYLYLSPHIASGEPPFSPGMWAAPWFPIRVTTTPRSPRSRSFSCSSFKDILDLCSDGRPDPECQPDSPRSPTIFHRVRLPGSSPPASPEPPPLPPPSVVLYFTSLRVVRRTFEDCRAVRSILRGLGIPIDERDLSMDARFVGELQGIMANRRRSVTLPCVFIGGRLVGGAEEVKRLYESGELARMVGAGSVAVGSRVCDLCGGLRYAVCDLCNGSRKIYGKSGFRTCNHCNMHGLIKCPSCSAAASSSSSSGLLDKPLHSSSRNGPRKY